ncbi:MAG: energy transducer TonB [Candidatus Edwardsbacteria bacterium]
MTSDLFYPLAGTFVGILISLLFTALQSKRVQVAGFGVKEAKILMPMHLKRSLMISLALMLFLMLAGVAYFAVSGYIEAHRSRPEVPVVRISYAELGAPPSLTGEEVVPTAVATAAAAPTVGIPKPVPDAEATVESGASQTELGALTAGAASEAGVGGGIVVNPEDILPEKGVFIPLEKQPVPIKFVRPVYPEIVKRAEIGGTVVVWLLLDFDGHVMKAEIAKSSGNSALDEAALEAGRQSLFTPAMQGEKPVRVWMSVPYRFSLK